MIVTMSQPYILVHTGHYSCSDWSHMINNARTGWRIFHCSTFFHGTILCVQPVHHIQSSTKIVKMADFLNDHSLLNFTWWINVLIKVFHFDQWKCLEGLKASKLMSRKQLWLESSISSANKWRSPESHCIIPISFTGINKTKWTLPNIDFSGFFSKSKHQTLGPWRKWKWSDLHH